MLFPLPGTPSFFFFHDQNQRMLGQLLAEELALESYS